MQEFKQDFLEKCLLAIRCFNKTEHEKVIAWAEKNGCKPNIWMEEVDEKMVLTIGGVVSYSVINTSGKCNVWFNWKIVPYEEALIKMERFENAQVGDLVYSETFGEGEIMSIYSDYLYVDHIGLITKWNKTGTYYDSVKANKPMQCLFYRKGEERYLTERPEPEINWDNEKPGARFEVSQDGISYSQKTFAGILSIGSDHFPVFLTATLCDTYQHWNHIRRIKP